MKYNHKAGKTYTACGISEKTWDKLVKERIDDGKKLGLHGMVSKELEHCLNMLGLKHTKENIATMYVITRAFKALGKTEFAMRLLLE